MFAEKQLDRYADVLLWGLRTARTRKATKSDNVLLRFDLAVTKMENLPPRGPAKSREKSR